MVFGGQTKAGALPAVGDAGGAVVEGACGVGGFDAGPCLAAAFVGQGLASGVVPVISVGDDGRSHRFLFCLHTSALIFFSAQPGL